MVNVTTILNTFFKKVDDLNVGKLKSISVN